MDTRNQCCAPSNGSRCPNIVLRQQDNEFKYCNNHHDQSIKLYLRYKKLSNRTDKMRLGRKFKTIQERIHYLLKFYVLLNKTYNARYKHQTISVDVSCQDKGHLYQLTKLQNLLMKCENLLIELNDEFVIENINLMNEIEELSEEDEDNNIVINNNDIKELCIKEQIKECIRLRIETERETNAFLDRCIKDNDEYERKSDNAIYNFQTIVNKYFNIKKCSCDGDQLTPEVANSTRKISNYALSAAVMNIYKVFLSLHYFEDNFSPQECEIPKIYLGKGCDFSEYGMLTNIKYPTSIKDIEDMNNRITNKPEFLFFIKEELIDHVNKHQYCIAHVTIQFEWNINKNAYVIKSAHKDMSLRTMEALCKRLKKEEREKDKRK